MRKGFSNLRKRNHEQPGSHSAVNCSMGTKDADRVNSALSDAQAFTLHKGDTTSTVVGIMKGSVLGMPHDFWVKRFNAKGVGDFLVQKILGSKGKRTWDVSRKLYDKGLPVPEPLAWFDPSVGCWHSFFLCRVIGNSENLANIIKGGRVRDLGRLLESLARTIAQWHSAGAVHGDMKWPNILLRKEAGDYEFFMVDLDRSRLYQRASIRGIEKDLSRFYRDGLELDVIDWVLSSFLPVYLNALPDGTRTRLNMAAVRNRAHREWEKRGKRTFATLMNKDTYSQGF